MTRPGFSLERSVIIRAPRSTVFRYFTDPARFARWWGEGSTIRAEVGGPFLVRYPNGQTASGNVLEIVENEHVLLTWGYDAPGKPIPPGGSRVTITLEDAPEGTLLKLRHEVADAATRDQHVDGWRYHLSVFARVVADEQHAGAETIVDRYFDAWNEPGDGRRIEILAEAVDSNVAFRDAFGVTLGLEDLAQHIRAIHRHMPGMRLERRGPLRHMQGTALVDWRGVALDGSSTLLGSNVFDFTPHGRIARVVGIPAPPP